jgi:hypothetical protein
VVSGQLNTSPSGIGLLVSHSSAWSRGRCQPGDRSLRPPSAPIRPPKPYSSGYAILSVADGCLKRHVGGLSWEIQLGMTGSSKVGFRGGGRLPPTGQTPTRPKLALFVRRFRFIWFWVVRYLSLRLNLP